MKKIGQAVMDGTRCDGFNIGMNNYEAAGQVVHHAHFHIIPRLDDDGLKHWPQGIYMDDDQREEFRKSIEERMDLIK